MREEQLDYLSKMQQNKHADIGDPEILSRISQYEMAFRMQTSVPDVMDLSKEPDSIFEMYGEDSRKP